MTAIMTLLGKAALKSREGVRLKAYLDTQGVPTIGYGRIKGVRMGQTITQAQADAFFEEDLASHALPILSCIKVPVSDNEQDALISIAFNIGVAGFRNSTFLKRLNAGDRKGCAEAIMFWTKNKELISRRTAERDQFLTSYSKAAPKARSTDARPVSVPLPPAPDTRPILEAQARAIEARGTTTSPVPPVFAPAPRNGGSPATVPPPPSARAPSLLDRILSRFTGAA